MTKEQLEFQQRIAAIVSTSKPLDQLKTNYESWIERKTASSKKTAEELEYWQKLADKKLVDRELDKLQAHIFEHSLFNSAEARAVLYDRLLSIHGQDLVISEKAKPVLRELSFYFAGLPSKLDANKGIFLFGPTGTGKSSLIRIFQGITNAYNYRYRRFLMNSIPWIYEESRNSQDFDLKDFTYYPRCFDDVGFNLPEVSRYGNKINPLEYILFERYNRYQRSGLLTHMTSNLPPDKLNEFLDRRIISRIKGMMNFVLLDGEDYRYIKKA